jgi:hypothetical protein
VDFGVIESAANGKIVGFREKPSLDYLVSMGIYVFNRDALVECLEKTDYLDFGKEIFPASVRAKRVMVHLFDGYWEDIGTIKSFFHANLELASQHPPFDLASPTEVQHARGSVVTDDDGTRQATLLFMPGTTAELVMPNGSSTPVTSLAVSATEYTIGSTGADAMPAELPPTSAYTYCGGELDEVRQIVVPVGPVHGGQHRRDRPADAGDQGCRRNHSGQDHKVTEVKNEQAGLFHCRRGRPHEPRAGACGGHS